MALCASWCSIKSARTHCLMCKCKGCGFCAAAEAPLERRAVAGLVAAASDGGGGGGAAGDEPFAPFAPAKGGGGGSGGEPKPPKRGAPAPAAVAAPSLTNASTLAAVAGPGQCAPWCDPTAHADQCDLGGCISCAACAAPGGGGKPLLPMPLLLPFPVPRHPHRGAAAATGVAIAAAVGGLALLLLASVLVRAYARDVWNRAIDRLPAPLAAALDAAASLGRGRRGFERASRTDDADEFDPFDSPPLAGNLKPPRPV